MLIVDDDDTLRGVLHDVLVMESYRVVQANSREMGLEQLASHPDIAVVILDLGMPPAEHSTEEGIAFIRELSARAHKAKIIVLTGQDEASSALQAISEGAFDFLAKPASKTEILQAVKRALLFYRNEQTMSDSGLTRLQLNARVADGLKAVREDAEERLVRQVLRETGFNVYQSAARLGVKRESIYYFLNKFNIKRDDS